MIIRAFGIALWRCVVAFTLCGVQLVYADQVTMKNGDRISGTILKSDAKALLLKSEYAGPITLPWDAVETITSAQPIFVGLKGGQVAVGVVTTSGDRLSIETKETGQVTAAKASVVYLRSKDEEAAYEAEYERYQNPRLTDLWAGFVDLGFAETRGNAQTTSFSLTANANRATSRDKIGVTFTSLYASNDTLGVSTVTANAIRGGISYNINLRKKLFAFASTDLEYDKFQNLDLRFVPAGGLGYHAIKSEKTTLDFLGGGSLNREFFSTGERRTSGEIVAGDEYVHNFTKTTSVREKFTLYPNISDPGSFRMNLDTSAVTALKKWLGWQVTLSDRYLSDPVLGRKKNDVIFTTGFRLSFAK